MQFFRMLLPCWGYGLVCKDLAVQTWGPPCRSVEPIVHVRGGTCLKSQHCGDGVEVHPWRSLTHWPLYLTHVMSCKPLGDLVPKKARELTNNQGLGKVFSIKNTYCSGREFELSLILSAHIECLTTICILSSRGIWCLSPCVCTWTHMKMHTHTHTH